jgi:hypothetical protein
MMYLTMAAAALLGGSATVNWSMSFDKALQRAHNEDKPLFAFFYWSSSEHAGAMRKQTLDQAEIAELLGDYVCYLGNYEAPGVVDLFKKYNVKASPTCMFFNSQGQPENWVGGVISPSEFRREAVKARDQSEGTVSWLRNAVYSARKGTEEAMEYRMDLAGLLEDLGDQDGHDRVVLEIRDMDPKGETLAGCRGHLLAMNRVLDGVDDGSDASYQDGESDSDGEDCEESCSEECGEDCEHAQAALVKAKAWDLKPFYRFAKTAKNREGRFEAWNTIGNREVRRADPVKAAKALVEASKLVPADQALDWHLNSAYRLAECEGEHSGTTKKTTLQLAERGVDLAELRRTELLSEWTEMEYNRYLAECLGTLAQTQVFAGKKSLAKKTYQRCTKLAPTESRYEEALAAL